MCWDISLHTDIEIVKQSFKIRDERRQLQYDLSRMENVQAIMFPQYPIIYRDKDGGGLGLTEMEWGILPTFISDPKLQTDRRRNMVNARSERILEDHKSYWYRLRNQRCLIPVSGTYEHRKISGWTKKAPYYITEKGRNIVYIPGLYQWHETIGPLGEPERMGSFALITRTANEVMKQIHNDGPNKHRMPLFLTEELERHWLDDLDEAAIQEVFSYEIQPDGLEYYPVYTLRGYPTRPDKRHRYEPYHWDGLPPLGDDKALDPQSSLF